MSTHRLKQGSWCRPSSDLHSCPQSAEYDCSPQAKEQATGLDIYIFFVQVFPQSAGDRTDKCPSGPKDARRLISMSSKSSRRVSNMFPKAHHTFWKDILHGKHELLHKIMPETPTAKAADSHYKLREDSLKLHKGKWVSSHSIASPRCK